MGKISPVSAKYIINADIEVEGVVDRPDVIGAIFGQTEGLLGADLELRELQRSGRIGRIEVNVDVKGGKSFGVIQVPSSLDKAETAIVGAALEIIQRIGPCNAKIKVKGIEDVRISKRSFVVERAKELLRTLTDAVLPDSQELSDEVAYSVRVMEITEYGRDRLPAGPNIDDSDEIIIVEGRADVLNLLKHGFKNCIALNGTSVVPPTIIELAKQKTITVFVDGDRGGDLILKALKNTTEIDFITKAPDGKEVEEITKKEIHKALRAKVAYEQVALEASEEAPKSDFPKGNRSVPTTGYRTNKQTRPTQSTQIQRPIRKFHISTAEKTKYRGMIEDLIGTKGAYILDDTQEILGKVPITELINTIKSMGKNINAIILDGSIDKNLVEAAEKGWVKTIVGMDNLYKSNSRINLLTLDDL